MGATQATSITTTRLAESPIRLFLMINTFETGGSERQFTVLAQSLNPFKFQLHLGCVSRRGPLADQLGNVAEYSDRAAVSYGWQSLRARLNLSRHLRHNHVSCCARLRFLRQPHAHSRRTPCARAGVIGSHRQLGDLMTAAQFRAQAVAFRWCDAVVCNSQAAAARLLAAGLAIAETCRHRKCPASRGV